MSELIALIERNQDLLGETAHSLENGGFQVKSAPDFECGLQLFIDNSFDLAIIDTETGLMGGLGFLQSWVEEAPEDHTPVIFLMSDAVGKAELDEIISQSHFKSRVIETLFKPIEPDRLTSFISTYFESKRFVPPKKSKVMAVDDSPILCTMYQCLFEKHEFLYEIVSDSTKAETIAQYFKPDLILMDASMPDIDGFTLTKNITSSKELASARVIMVTADSRKSVILQSLINGAVDILNKPFDEEILLAKMKSHLDKKRVYDELSGAYQRVKATNERLSALAATDSLTGLYNHGRLHEYLIKEISKAKRHDRSLALVMLDVDHFKRFNDKYGHRCGDEALRTLAVVLQGALRDGDVPARYGGEEFCIILPETDLEGGALVAEKIRNVVENTLVSADCCDETLTVSLGVAQWKNGCSAIKLIDSADKAMYVSKNSGRNQVTKA